MVFAVLAPEALGFMGLGQRKACILCVHGCVCVCILIFRKVPLQCAATQSFRKVLSQVRRDEF